MFYGMRITTSKLTEEDDDGSQMRTSESKFKFLKSKKRLEEIATGYAEDSDFYTQYGCSPIFKISGAPYSLESVKTLAERIACFGVIEQRELKAIAYYIKETMEEHIQKQEDLL